MTQTKISALCNPVRLGILECLNSKEKTVSELVSLCGLSQSAVSQHLLKLREAGLVKTLKIGKNVYYSLSNPKIAEICSQILNLSKEEI